MGPIQHSEQRILDEPRQYISAKIARFDGTANEPKQNLVKCTGFCHDFLRPCGFVASNLMHLFLYVYKGRRVILFVTYHEGHIDSVQSLDRAKLFVRQKLPSEFDALIKHALDRFVKQLFFAADVLVNARSIEPRRLSDIREFCRLKTSFFE